MRSFLLLMSLLSMLFGCGKSAQKKMPYPEALQFPQTDNTRCAVQAIAMDSGLYAQAFILSPDKTGVFMLAYGMEGTPEKMPYQLIHLDADGNVQHKIILKDSHWTDQPTFWWETDGSLHLMLHTEFLRLDPATFQVLKRWKQWDYTNFLSQKQFDQLTYDKQDNAYRETLKKKIAKSSHAQVLQVFNLHFMMLDFAGKTPEAWYLRSDDLIGKYSAEFGLQKATPTMQPEPKITPGMEETKPDTPYILIADGDASLQWLIHRTLDYKFAYPDLKYIEERVLELSAKGQKARFRLTNQDKHDLYLKYADNALLQTVNGAVWWMYERELYKIEM